MTDNAPPVSMNLRGLRSWPDSMTRRPFACVRFRAVPLGAPGHARQTAPLDAHCASGGAVLHGQRSWSSADAGIRFLIADGEAAAPAATEVEVTLSVAEGRCKVGLFAQDGELTVTLSTCDERTVSGHGQMPTDAGNQPLPRFLSSAATTGLR